MRIEHLFYEALISQPRAFDIIKNLWYNIKKRVFARSEAGFKEKIEHLFYAQAKC